MPTAADAKGGRLYRLAIEWDSRSSSRHLLALALVVTIATALSSVTVPYWQSDTETIGYEHVAYGYFYFPVIAAPIIASWARDPWTDLAATRRRKVSCAVWNLFLLALVTASAGLLGWAIEGANVAQLCGENALWVTALVLAAQPLGFEWASILPLVYGTVGLVSASWPGFLINREPRAADLLAGLILALGWATRPLWWPERR